MARKSVPAPFLIKTYDLVDDGETNDVVSWNENGTGFVVLKTADFAMDLLPNYFKHNNFSSFVRQLNTYGFRKVVPEKWEFANENFRRGNKDLLSEIRRRKPVAPMTGIPEAVKCAALSNSGDDLGSTSMSSPDSKNPGSIETATKTNLNADLSEENEKLKCKNEILTSELDRYKNQTDKFVKFLTENLKFGPDQINEIINNQGSGGSGVLYKEDGVDVDDDGGDCDDGSEEVVVGGGDWKLFGVWLSGEKKKKRARVETLGASGGLGPDSKNRKV